MSSAAAIRSGRAYIEFFTKNNPLRQGLKQAQSMVAGASEKMKAAGTKMLQFGTVAAAGFAASTVSFASFDDAMRKVKAVSQATEQELQTLTEKAIELGKATSFTTNEVAGLMAELGKAGFSPTEIEGMTSSVLSLARATDTEAVEASGIFAATMRQFNIPAEQGARVADGLTAAANKSFNSVTSLGNALQYAGPVAREANLSLEDTLAILGSLGNVGIQGSQAGTALKRLLTLSGAEAKKFKEVFNVDTTDAVGNVRPLVDILSDVARATEDLGTAARTQKFNEVFGMLGITAAGALGRSVSDTRKLAAEIKAAKGIAKATADEMEQGQVGHCAD